MAVADRPTVVPVEFVFDDVNPCTGGIHTVMMSGTAWIHEHNGRFVVNSKRTITTSTGFEGRGADTFVSNEQVEVFVLNDMLVHESGDRIRAHFGIVIDLSTGTVLAITGGPVECLGL